MWMYHVLFLLLLACHTIRTCTCDRSLPDHHRYSNRIKLTEKFIEWEEKEEERKTRKFVRRYQKFDARYTRCTSRYVLRRLLYENMQNAMFVLLNFSLPIRLGHFSEHRLLRTSVLYNLGTYLHFFKLIILRRYLPSKFTYWHFTPCVGVMHVIPIQPVNESHRNFLYIFLFA